MKKKLIINGNEVEITIKSNRLGHLKFEFNGKEYDFEKKSELDNILKISGDTGIFTALKANEDVLVSGKEFKVALPTRGRASSGSSEETHMLSPMPGKILKVMVKVGDYVVKGDSLVVMEAMKMEHTIKAAFDGIVTTVNYQEGDQVSGGVDLVEVDKSDIT